MCLKNPLARPGNSGCIYSQGAEKDYMTVICPMTRELYIVKCIGILFFRIR